MRFDNKHEELKSTLEESLEALNISMSSSLEAMQQFMLETNQQLIESCAHMKVHFDQIMTHLTQPASTPIPDQTQEFHQLCQVNRFDIPQDFTSHVDTIFESVHSSFHLN